MRIAEVHVYRVALPLSGTIFQMSDGAYTEFDSTIVEIVSDTGVSGWGETCPIGPTYAPEHAAGARAALGQMAPGLIGRTVTGPREVQRVLHGLLNGHNYATPRPPSTSRSTTSSARPTACGCATCWAAPRANNRALTSRDALRLSRECADIPLVLEQPCNTMEEIAAIRGQLHHAVYLDENTESVGEVLRAISLGVCDGFGLKVTRLGGLGAMATLRDVCEARSLPHTCDDSWGGDITAAACAHVAATVHPRLLDGVWLAEPFMAGHYDSTNPVRVDRGRIAVPTGPGLGVVPDEGAFGTPVASFA